MTAIGEARPASGGKLKPSAISLISYQASGSRPLAVKPLFATSQGLPPAYLASVDRGKNGRGTLEFNGGRSGLHRVAFESESQLRENLKTLIASRVPFSVGGPSIGPTDEVEILINMGELAGPYLQISWSRPGSWTVRQVVVGATEWEPADIALLAAVDFDPGSLVIGKR